MVGKSLCTSLFLLGLWLATPPAAAQNLTVELVAAGLESPIFVDAPDGDFNRIFIIEQTGAIRVVRNGTLLATPFLDVDPISVSGGEQGLLGLAFHPDFLSNGRFFIHYTDNGGDSQVVEYEVVGNPATTDVANSTPVQTIFSHNQPFSNHNGGCIRFGPDGMLYIAMGDGGSGNDPGNRAQNPLQHLGKMLRYDVDLPAPFIPPDNPFVGDPNTLDDIWALGLRNPWRFSFDRATGDLWIADVGQVAREEVNFQPASSTGGENYGWRCMEGFNCTGLSGCTCNSPSLTLPVHDYGHGLGCAVTGGYAYRGNAIPALRGTYFFGDFCSSNIWSFRLVNGVVTEFTNRTGALSGPIGNLPSFGEDAAGELYICDHSGEVYRIVEDCDATNYCISQTNSSGQPAVMDFNNSLSISANDFELVALSAAPTSFGLFFYGPAQVQVPFGDGFQCVGAGGRGIFRLQPPVRTNSFGDVTRPVDFRAPPAAAGAGEITPGSTWNFQFWFRDVPAGGAGFNLTDGLSALFCP